MRSAIRSRHGFVVRDSRASAPKTRTSQVPIDPICATRAIEAAACTGPIAWRDASGVRVPGATRFVGHTSLAITGDLKARVEASLGRQCTVSVTGMDNGALQLVVDVSDTRVRHGGFLVHMIVVAILSVIAALAGVAACVTAA